MVDLEESGNEADVSQEAPSAPDTDSNESTPEAAETQSAKEAPFHEHPRFKELIEEKNQYAASLREMQTELARLRDSVNSRPTEAKKDALVEKLRGIDPELAARIERSGQTDQTVAELQQQIQSQQVERIRDQASSELNRLYSENKIPSDAQRFYRSAIKDMADANPNASIKDLPKYFKEVHETFSKYTESLKRSDRESYVTGKKADAKAPTGQPKGQAAKPSKPGTSKDAELARSEIAAGALKRWKAGSSI